MEKEFIMGIDSGTQSVRAIVYDRQGNEVAVAKAAHDPYFSLKPGWSEQKPDDYWKKLCQVTRQVMSSKDFDSQKLAGIGITTQRGGVFPVDKEGTPLRNAIIWLDQRFTEDPPPVRKKIKILFGLIGKGDLIATVQRNSYFTWIKKYEREIYDKAHKFCQVSSWFVKRLTDNFHDSASMYVGYWPLEAKKFDWYGMDDVLEVFGVERDHLPKLFRPNEVLGQITKRASKETGLPEGLPVVVGAGDKQSESLGTGVMTPDVGTISFGTAATMGVVSKKYLDDSKLRFFTWCSALPDAWILESFIYRGFWLARWFTQEMGQREAVEAEKRNMAPEAVLDEVIRDIPPGSMGLMLQPHWTPHPSMKHSKGSIVGFTSAHTRAHIYRAILEGIVFELRRLGTVVQKRTGVPLKELRIGGGGSKSDVAVQIAADIFSLPAKRMRTYETCALGAAIDAAVGVGMFGNFQEAVDSMVEIGRVFEPNAQNAKIYDELFKDVYLKTNDALSHLYKRSTEITGYSEN
ncbi:MAG: carbohydrate kinase [Proteobacteria bacterium]|nr:carbohydrate kinase [Pseudomonadota bacterium]